MIDFNCTVKDLFRRRDMITKAVWSLADNGFTEHASTYALVRHNLYKALAYAAGKMRDYEYRVAIAYLESADSEQEVALRMFYTHRTIRRYVHKACEYVGEYFANEVGIRLLPIDTRSVECIVSGGTFWEKTDSLMNGSIENACVVIAHCHEHMSVSSICTNYGMGSEKVKKIIRSFGSVITVYNIPSPKRSAV
ncbi:MAG: hypothetical protein IKE92_10190 [Clostridiales bacterium]|jgi:hypothetical protein|nr:hypothetical protein [Clostridiales bacterium]